MKYQGGDLVQALVQQHHAFYEVQPYYIVFEERLPGQGSVPRRIQAGFDIDVYGVKGHPDPAHSPEYALGYSTLRELAHAAASQAKESCSIEVIPFASTVVLDARRHLLPLAMLRIRITHSRGLDRPSGASEENTMKAIRQRLKDLGISEGRRV